MKRTEIRRDPFARATLVRALVPKYARKECPWCGWREGKFRYAWESDDDPSGRRVSRILDGQDGFCSVDCWEAYQ